MSHDAAVVEFPSVRKPDFEPIVVEDGLADGYWIQAVDIDGDGQPDLLTSGLVEGVVAWHENGNWSKHPIHQFNRPVSLDQGDIAGDGHVDLVVCHDYAKTMFEATPADGRVSWLRNPGPGGGAWEARPIGQLGSTHRLRLGHFTRSDQLELLALPVVGPEVGRAALHAPIRVTLFTPPADILDAGDGWDAHVVDDITFRVIHAAALGRYGRPSPSGLDATVLASEEGLSWFGATDTGEWTREALGSGELDQQARTGYKGSGNVAIGRRGDDPFAFIAAVEPFHGNTLALYTPQRAGDGVVGRSWRRSVVEVFGEPNDAGEGPAHHVVAADFDGDGDDEFLVALRGPEPYQGVVYYKPVDLDEPRLERQRVSTPSAARIAVADFDGDGRLDFATIGYYVPGYFLCTDPKVVVQLNRFGDPIGGQTPIPFGPLGG
jgi:hypothetical protein